MQRMHGFAMALIMGGGGGSLTAGIGGYWYSGAMVYERSCVGAQQGERQMIYEVANELESH